MTTSNITTSSINRDDIGEQLLTSIGSNHFETKIVDGYYRNGEHAAEHGAILQDHTKDYRLYYSFDGIGIDIIGQDIHIILSTSNYGTPFHQYMWCFIGQNTIRHIFSPEAISEQDRIDLPRRMIKDCSEVIETFTRHIKRMVKEDFKAEHD